MARTVDRQAVFRIRWSWLITTISLSSTQAFLGPAVQRCLSNSKCGPAGQMQNEKWAWPPTRQHLSQTENDEFEYARSKSRRGVDTKDYYDEDAETQTVLENDEEWEYYDVYEDDDDEGEEYDMLENVLIPNPLLDSIDPDGAADRFPELAKDPRFWFDMVLFLTFLDFLSFVGPRDPFPDLPLPY